MVINKTLIEEEKEGMLAFEIILMMGTIRIYNYTCVYINESICMELDLFYFQNILVS